MRAPSSRAVVLSLVVSSVLLWSLPAAAQEVPFQRGEVNQDGGLDISDALAIVFHLYRGGFEVSCEKAADADDNGAVEITDAIYELNFLFRSGPPPRPPFGTCGKDPTPDSLTCLETTCSQGDPVVIISEIMTSNLETLEDEDGDSSDWIELHVPDSAPVASLDLSGWFLTDDETLADLWRIPDGVELERGGFLLIFASGKDRAIADAELHADFQLDKDREYLGIVAPDGVTVIDEFSPFYPQQLSDVSYGRSQSTTALVPAGASVLYRVPSSADSGLGDSWTRSGFAANGWSTGRTGLGFSSISTDGFQVRYVKANVAVDHLTVAQDVLNDTSKQVRVVTGAASFVDHFNSGGSGNFSNDIPFPGTSGTDVDDFVVLVTGTILIPATGNWSFGVNSDDGFGLTLRGGGRTYTMSHPTPRGPSDTIQVFNIAVAGPHEVSLVFYERGGGSGLELFAAQGFHPSFNGNFRLVGDTAAGGLSLLGFAGEVETDVSSEMQGVNSSLWMRAEFDASDAGAFGGLVLQTKYEDGFVAFLNGEEVARRRSPSTLAWNSRSSSNRPIEDAGIAETINLTSSLPLLENGSNVLAIHALNDSAANGDFLILPELVAAGRISELRYMSEPTPGAFNTSGAVDFVRDVEFSVEHGFYDASFQLELLTSTRGAQIRYTLDGSTPARTRGSIYSSPITISGTRVVRAAAFKIDYLDSNVVTQSYIFVSDVKRQSPLGQAPGPGWPAGSVNGQILDYGMDPDVVNNARWSGQIEDALLSIPSISLATDLANLFSSSTGIYVNARNDGRAWERRVSAELIYPDGTPGFAFDAGLRIRGAFSRSGDNPKHSLRLFFRREYSVGRLPYALFGGEGVDEFDKVDLRTSQNYSWAFQGSDQNTFLRDVFSRDAQRDMGQLYARSRYYHLYLNGHYWGLYQTEERISREFAESYLGGDEDEYDVIKNDSSGSRALHASDGTMEAYRRLYDAAVAGFTTDTAYLRVLGLRSDGTPNPSGEMLLDPENLMDYMVCTYYTGDPDAPVSAWAHFSNNVFAVYNRVQPDGFKWFRHDAEHSLGANGGLFEARLLTDPVDRSIGQEWQHFNPAWLHLRLTAHPEYRLQFADRVNKHFSEGGVFSPERNIERWMDRANQIDLAVIAASARWGDSKVNPPRTKDHWQGQVDYMVNTYFPQRTQIVLGQMRSVNMFPNTAIVSFSKNGGHVDSGFELWMTQGNGTSGTIYYTLDGSDPRLWGGAVNPIAQIFSDESAETTFIARGSVWKYRDDGSNQGTAWRMPGFADGAWASGPAQLGYGDGDEATEVDFGPDPNNKYITTYFRRTFAVEDASEVIELTLGLVRDDGAAVYLNGVEAIPRSNLPAGTITYQTPASSVVGGGDEATFFTFSVDPGLLVDGTNVIAVEVHQIDGTSSDISFDLELTGRIAGGEASSIVLDETTTVRARVRAGSQWGAMTEARFAIGLLGLVVNEVMAANRATLQDPDELGEFPDWIELYNGTAGPIDLGGMYLTDDLQDLRHWQIAPGVTIGVGEHLVFLADDDGTQGPLHTNFQLSRSGEAVALVDRDGTTVLDSVIFDTQFEDISFGRFPNGTGSWDYHSSPTPGSPNSAHAN